MKGIEVKNVRKIYEKKLFEEDAEVFMNLSLTIKPQTIYGLLGRNGEGKTTLLKLLANKLAVNQGKILLDGTDIKDNQKCMDDIFLVSSSLNLGFSKDTKDLFEQATILMRKFDIEKAWRIIKRFGITEKNKTRIKDMSQGQFMIAQIAVALASDCNYLLFDEPVSALDPKNRSIFYEVLLEDYADYPRTFVISSHIINEMTNIFERVIILSDKKISYDLEADEIVNCVYRVFGKREDVKTYTKDKDVISTIPFNQEETRYVLGAIPQTTPEGILIERVTLEEAFVYLT